MKLSSCAISSFVRYIHPSARGGRRFLVVSEVFDSSALISFSPAGGLLFFFAETSSSSGFCGGVVEYDRHGVLCRRLEGVGPNAPSKAAVGRRVL